MAAALGPDQVVYYWNKNDGEARKARVDHCSRLRPGHVVLKGGATLPFNQVFASREEAASSGKVLAFGKSEDLASGSTNGTSGTPSASGKSEKLASGSTGGTSLASGNAKEEQPTEESLPKRVKKGEQPDSNMDSSEQKGQHGRPLASVDAGLGDDTSTGGNLIADDDNFEELGGLFTNVQKGKIQCLTLFLGWCPKKTLHQFLLITQQRTK